MRRELHVLRLPKKDPARYGGFRTRNRIMLFLQEWFAVNLVPPTCRQIGVAIGMSDTNSQNVSNHLRRLRSQGFVDFKDIQHGTLRLTDKGWNYMRPLK